MAALPPPIPRPLSSEKRPTSVVIPPSSPHMLSGPLSPGGRTAAAPPTPQEVQRKLGSLNSPGPNALGAAGTAPPPASSTGPATLTPAGTVPHDLHRRLSSSQKSSSGLSSAEEDEPIVAPTSPSRSTQGLPVPLSSISETASDAMSGSESEASLSDGERERSSRGPLALVDKALERLKTGGTGDGTKVGEEAAVKSSWLYKRGERRKAWKKRWFVLRGGQLAMYKTDKEYRLLRLIPLTDIHSCSPVEIKKHQYTFGIVTPKRTYYIKAASQAEASDWCTSITRAKAENKTLSTVTTLETPSPGDVTPKGTGAQTPTIAKSTAVPIPRANSSIPQRQLSTSPLSFSSMTSTSSSVAPSVVATSSGYRPPPNLFAQAGMGALAGQGSGGLELSGVDSSLDRVARGSSSASGGEELALPSTSVSSTSSAGYFALPSQNDHRGNSNLQVPPLSPGGLVSSSEDEVDEEGAPNAVTKTPGADPFGDPNKVIVSGYLMKQGKRKNWRKRWFVLMSTRLVYAKSHMDTRIHRSIPLTRICDAIEHVPSSPTNPIGASHASSNTTSGESNSLAGGGAEHCFKIITPKRTYVVCAPTEEDEIKWLAALQCLVKRKTVPPTVTESGNAPQPPVRKASDLGGPQSLGQHGRQRSVTDAAKQAVNLGLSNYREKGPPPASPSGGIRA